MKFITIVKIYITIFALIQLSFTTSLETNSKSRFLAKAELKSNLKSRNKVNSGRYGIIDINNIFNPSFQNNKTEGEAGTGVPGEPGNGVPGDKNSTDQASDQNKNKKAEKTTDQILSDWLMISSDAFRDKKKFPDIYIKQTSQYLRIETDNMDFRINNAFNKNEEDKENGPRNATCFWFRLSGLNIYYSSTVTDLNILGSISIAHVLGLINLENDHSGYFCFIIRDKSGIEWKICSEKIEKRNTWVCAIQSTLGVGKEAFCGGDKKEEVKVVDHNIIQPYIVIPLPSRKCNEKWNYQQLGRDWECECSEGKEQSPIDLPKKEEALETDVRPSFQYERIEPVSRITTIDGQMQENQNIQIRYEDNAIRIKHMKFGKVVTPDGAVYFAEEIVIHTPSEHKIKGKQYDMEVQIVHYGQSKGDIAKQLTLSFLFEKKAGVYNKFLDDLDFFNLPSPTTPRIDMIKDIFIPRIFYEASSTDIPVMKPFSYYTYQGSLTFPPCVEDTIVYVASKPLRIGTTALQLFTEALRIPDTQMANGNLIISDAVPISRREVQPLNGRPVFHFDHDKQCGPEKDIELMDEGHFEKIKKTLTKYFYVPDEKPSGIPNSSVVSKSEAMGLKRIKA